jgi:hypothetical protein
VKSIGRVGDLFLAPGVTFARIQFIQYSERSSICTIFKGVLKQKPLSSNIYIYIQQRRKGKQRPRLCKPQLIHKFLSGLKAKYRIRTIFKALYEFLPSSGLSSFFCWPSVTSGVTPRAIQKYPQLGGVNVCVHSSHSPTMPEINSTALQALRSRLKAATIYTPESESYKDVIVRWSDTGMKYAVRNINITNETTD